MTISLRDQFAMAAMQGSMTLGRSEEKVAEMAYKQADAMLAERNKTKEVKFEKWDELR